LIDVSQKELAGLLKYRETQKSEFRNSISCFLFIFSWALPVAKNEGCFLIQRNTGKERERETNGFEEEEEQDGETKGEEM
jgi:hypothetical protein